MVKHLILLVRLHKIILILLLFMVKHLILLVRLYQIILILLLLMVKHLSLLVRLYQIILILLLLMVNGFIILLARLYQYCDFFLTVAQCPTILCLFNTQRILPE